MPALMIQGTASGVGKSMVVAGLCRLLARRGYSVAPFKPQNMSLNSAVTEDGGEIGRAQAMQAQASYLIPHSDMNPILLKPESDRGAQVIVAGKAVATMDARQYHQHKPALLATVLAAYQRLCRRYQWVIVEGAGSPAEVNLRQGDLANMGFALAADCPVWLIADIDRGGVFANLVGTMDLLNPKEKDMVQGFMINRFRGDITILEDGLHWLKQRLNRPLLGVLPYLENLYLDAEDGRPEAYHNAIPVSSEVADKPPTFHISVLEFPRISNHTDFTPLSWRKDITLSFVRGNQPLPKCDLVILPGSKNVREDLRWLKTQGWQQDLLRHLRYGGKILGICGGFQMLGQVIADPHGIEGPAGQEEGLKLLDIATTLTPKKQLTVVNARLFTPQGTPMRGYEIHAGRSTGQDLQRPMVWLEQTSPDSKNTDGACSSDGQVSGTYCHGLFDEVAATCCILEWAGHRMFSANPEHSHQQRVDGQLDRLATMLEQHLKIDAWQQLNQPHG